MKGHILIIRNKDLFNDLEGKVLLEIGSDRNFGSTGALANLALALGMKFITVDVDKSVNKKAKNTLKEIDESFDAVLEYGERFLEKYDKKDIGLVYLDAFDFWHSGHSKERLESYKKRGTELTNENCWEMHYKCAVALSKIMEPNTYICFDDVKSGPPNWEGKGKLAIPYLLENGFEIVKKVPDSILLKKSEQNET